MVPQRDDYLGREDQVEIRTVRVDSESILDAIVRGLAVIEEVHVTDLDPLYEIIDTEALNSLLEHSNRTGGEISVEFTVDGYTVLVSQDGSVCIHDGNPVMTDVIGDL